MPTFLYLTPTLTPEMVDPASGLPAVRASSDLFAFSALFLNLPWARMYRKKSGERPGCAPLSFNRRENVPRSAPIHLCASSVARTSPLSFVRVDFKTSRPTVLLRGTVLFRPPSLSATARSRWPFLSFLLCPPIWGVPDVLKSVEASPRRPGHSVLRALGAGNGTIFLIRPGRQTPRTEGDSWFLILPF